jgi:anaerobic selenocysteine-containing dehydrogenase
LPLCSFVETSGSFTNSFRVVNAVNQVISPVSGYETWQILIEIVKVLGIRYKFDYAQITDIQKEIVELVPAYSKIDFSKSGSSGTWDLSLIDSALDLRNSIKLGLTLDLVTTGASWTTNSVKTWFKTNWENLKLSDREPYYLQTK